MKRHSMNRHLAQNEKDSLWVSRTESDNWLIWLGILYKRTQIESPVYQWQRVFRFFEVGNINKRKETSPL